MSNENIEMFELYLTEENFDKNIKYTINTANRELRVSKEFKDLAFYNPRTMLKQDKPNCLIGFPISITALLEYSACQILPTTSLSIAEYTIEKIMRREYPISCIKFEDDAFIHETIDQCARFNGKLPDQIISYLLRTSIFNGDIEGMMEFVNDVKRTVRKEVIDDEPSITVFDRYLQYIRLKEGW